MLKFNLRNFHGPVASVPESVIECLSDLVYYQNSLPAISLAMTEGTGTVVINVVG